MLVNRILPTEVADGMLLFIATQKLQGGGGECEVRGRLVGEEPAAAGRPKSEE